VEPHYFAGYTGGRKSIVPGVAGFETIESNHRLALHKDAQALKLEGNPVNEDMECAVRLLDKEIFGIQLVVSDKICYASAGSMNDAFKACVKKAEEVFTLKVKDRADVVVTVANHPMDIDLYQSQKAIDNAKHALKKDGIIILVSACRMGIGGKDFYNLLSTRTTPEAVFEEIKKGYKFGYHKAAKLAEVMLYAQIWAVTNLHPDILKKINFKPYARLENAINDALLQKGKDAHIIFLIDGSTTIPVV
jgi:nickel-dependent lactate racemase